MFSGIVVGSFPCLRFIAGSSRIQFKKPKSFTHLKEGDSVSVNGVCLTVETLKKNIMTFALGTETLKITKWRADSFKNKKFNLENSLSLNDALGGHFVTGHVDGLAKVVKCKKEKGSLLVTMEVPKKFVSFLWPKAYISINGVSLTINSVQGNRMEVCVIPKTLEFSNLSDVKLGDFCLFEVDYLIRSLVHKLHSLPKSEK